MELWAFSLMELVIFSIIVLGTLRWAFRPPPETGDAGDPVFSKKWAMPALFLIFFLLFVFFQMVPLPSELLKILSPKTYALRKFLIFVDHQSTILNPQFAISFVPFATQIEFFKWFSLIALFLFLLKWRPLEKGRGTLISVIIFIGILETLYGIVEFSSGHRHILNLDASSIVSSVTGTFINRNYFAGYLLMAIPLAVGYLFHRESHEGDPFGSWYRRLSSIDGKTYFLAFGVILMILGLLLSASRMGMVSLLLSFTVVVPLFRNRGKKERFSRLPGLFLGLAVVWAAWIGLDAVISRFFTAAEDLSRRREIWADTLQIIGDFPLLGSGLGTFAQIFPAYRSFHVEGIVTHAENDFLQLVSEVGLVGTGLLTVAFLFLFRRALSGIRELSLDDSQRYIGIGGLVGILGLMFHSIVERNIQVPANAFLYTFLLAMILGIRGRKGKAEFAS
jgi:O-antigen ligase